MISILHLIRLRGYYHIGKLCVDYSSKQRSNIDNTLINHKLIEFQRVLLNIKGIGR